MGTYGSDEVGRQTPMADATGPVPVQSQQRRRPERRISSTIPYGGMTASSGFRGSFAVLPNSRISIGTDCRAYLLLFVQVTYLLHRYRLSYILLT